MSHSLKTNNQSVIFYQLLFGVAVLGGLLFIAPDHAKAVENGPIYADHNDGSNYDTYRVAPDGSSQTNVTATESSLVYDTSVAPDGTKLSFTTDRDGNEEIYKMSTDGTDPANLTNNPGADYFSDWGSPNKITFTSTRDGNREVYVMNADGSNQINISNNAATDDYSFISPDGTKVTFESDRDGNVEVYVMNADGTNVQRLTTNSALDYPTGWSIDSLHILFASDVNSGSNVLDLYSINVNGSELIRLTTNLEVYGAKYSPDGTKIALTAWDGAAYQLFTMNADGTGIVQITNDADGFGQLAWGRIPATTPPSGAAIGQTTSGGNFDPSSTLPEAGANESVYLLTVVALFLLHRLRRRTLEY